jgi:hypothetical protein
MRAAPRDCHRLKTVLSGRGDEIIDLVRVNLFR